MKKANGTKAEPKDRQTRHRDNKGWTRKGARKTGGGGSQGEGSQKEKLRKERDKPVIATAKRNTPSRPRHDHPKGCERRSQKGKAGRHQPEAKESRNKSQRE